MLFEAPDGIIALSGVSSGKDEGKALEGRACTEELVN